MIQLAGFKVREKIYESNRTVVYQGSRIADNKPVILKALVREFPSPEEIAKFENEYEITRNLPVDGVVQVYSLEKAGNSPVIVLEDFGGMSLSEIIQNEKISMKDFLSLSVRLADILGNLHMNGVIHKDINPSNIIWNTRKDQVKLIDFGIAAKISRENQEIFNPNVSEGTLNYISPEQTGRMNRSMDYRSDYYSLGVTFYELISGKLPFNGNDPMAQIHAHIAKEAKPLKNFRVSFNQEIIPGVISDIVAKLMAKSPEDRYQSALSLKADLHKSLVLFKKTGTVYDFEIAKNDISDKFQIPEKLYGCDDEIEKLKNAFNKVQNGSVEVMLVSGYAGAGKSALVREMYKFIVPGNGYFLRGKYQKLSSEIPYSGIILAFRELIRQLFQETNEKLEQWKVKLHQALYPNGRIISDLIPEIEGLIGPQQEICELDPAESHNRFLFTFGNFIRAFLNDNVPLVIFLDDLQWGDVSSFHLIESILSQEGIHNLFLIGAYRINEIDEIHPLTEILNKMKTKIDIHEILISPLNADSLNQILADTLLCEPYATEPLAKIVHNKTGGNPFFVKEFLNNLYRLESIYFDYEHGEWKWKLDKIRNSSVSENVVELLNLRLNGLNIGTRNLLNLASCLGNVFDFNTLVVVSEQLHKEVADAVTDAMVQGFIFPLTSNYRLVHYIGSSPDSRISYQFQHDRIRQAAYSMVDDEKKKEFHLKIGRLMLGQFNPEHYPEKLIDIVHHLNYGVSLIKDKDELDKLKIYNLTVGEKAKNSNAYHSAFQYLTIARDLLDHKSWEEERTLAFQIHKSYAECAYLCNKTDFAKKSCAVLLRFAHNNLEKATVKEMQAVHCNFLWKMEDSIQEGIAGLRYLGIRISSKPSLFSILKSLFKVKWLLRHKSLQTIASQSKITNPEVKLALKLLINFIPPAYMSGNGNLFAVAILKKTYLAIKYGNSAETPAAYTGYAALLAGLGDLNGAWNFGKLGVQLTESYRSLEWKSMIYNLYALFSVSWNEDWHEFYHLYKKAIDYGFKSGDLLYTAFAANFINLWNPEMDLKMQIEEAEKYLVLIERTGIEIALLAARLGRQKFLNFRGETIGIFSLSDERYNENENLERMQQIKYESGIAQYYLYKTQIHFMYDDYLSAIEYVKKTDNVIKSLAGSPYMVEYSVFAFLSHSVPFLRMKWYEKKLFWRRIQKEYKRMKKWRDHSPANFSHHYYLMKAEIARITGNYFKAITAYNEAIKASENNKNRRYIALCYEMAARFYLTNSEDKVGMIFLKDAYSFYIFWGAAGKTKHMESLYPELVGYIKNKNELLPSTKISSSGTLLIDLTTIMKASTVISGEIRITSLLEKLMKIMIENAGARRGVFINTEGDLLVESEGYADFADVKVLQNIPVEQEGNLPISLIQYVARTGNFVMAKNAYMEDRFRNDPYIKENKVKSILCAPVSFQGTIISIFYFENNLLEGAFTPQRLEVLNILFAQASISLKNARYYELLEKRIEERTKELEKARHMAEELARTDVLSGLPNRRSFYEKGETEILRSFRYSSPLSAILIDIDFFKIINDTYGHAAGDIAIVALAQVFRDSIRGLDIPGRLGGEEFAILLPDTAIHRAKQLAERIQNNIKKIRIAAEEDSFGFTASFGITQYNKKEKETLDQLIGRADKALYQAKTSGRNRIVVIKK